MMFGFISKIIKKHKINNQGSTMVEVLVGFTILVIVLVECMVHIVGVSGEMVEKSVDMQNSQATLIREMYKKDAEYVPVEDTKLTLTLDKERTNVTANQAQDVEIVLNSSLSRFYSDEAELSVFKLIFKGN
ncbi:MAG: hypothetical protein IJ053_04125 [Lachnospiraceae bacterium]|nr:hypothetical protein [Lachnospiraceae bacterium]